MPAEFGESGEVQPTEQPTASIHFGTDGWRGIIAKEFTFQNVGRVAQAIADYLKSAQRKELNIYTEWGVQYCSAERGVVVGHDTRFMSRDFAVYLGRVIRSNGIPVYIAAEPIPTPALSLAVEDRKLAAGLMITASHNPPQYNGIKIKPEYAGSASPRITKLIESFLRGWYEKPKAGKHDLEKVDLKTPYLDRIKRLIDFEILKGAPVKAIVDSMYGSGRGYVAAVLEEAKVPYIQIRSDENPYFGRWSPEPLARNLTPLKAVMAAERIRNKGENILVGVATDGDGDRIAGMDEQGNLIDVHLCFTLILRHLLERGWGGKVVKSISITDMVDKICEKYRLSLIVTPIGFKHICERMIREDVLIGGEEPGGIGIKNHIPERDGTLMSLLLLEIAAKRGKPLSEVIASLMEELGHHHFRRLDLHLLERQEIVERLKRKPPDSFAGRRITDVDTLDGIKLRFEDGWLMFRASGTEPLLRIYAEMNTKEKLDEVLSDAEGFAKGKLKLWG